MDKPWPRRGVRPNPSSLPAYVRSLSRISRGVSCTLFQHCLHNDIYTSISKKFQIQRAIRTETMKCRLNRAWLSQTTIVQSWFCTIEIKGLNIILYMLPSAFSLYSPWCYVVWMRFLFSHSNHC